jgi:spore maturation protein CgeB
VPTLALRLQFARPAADMKLVVFGLAISSSWGNGHATLWRGLCRALARRGHLVVFFERDVPYYASYRDMWQLPDGRLHLYQAWDHVADLARRELADADAGMITSFCPDACAAENVLLDSRTPVRAFYDLDTPVTLDRLARGENVFYIGPDGLAGYDVVLSYTGGAALDDLRRRLGARVAVPLYGSVDPDVHQPVAPVEEFRCDLSYLGTYAADRQDAVERLFLEPARLLATRRFVLGGSQYPLDFPWSPNIYYKRHMSPDRHPAFYCSSRMTLNVTRRAMALSGYCPSGRVFEAAACGVPILSDGWAGLEQFFTPGEEILVASSTADAVGALECADEELLTIARRARERTLAEHTADRRVAELERILSGSVNHVDDATNVDGKKDDGVGNHSGRRCWDADSAAGVFEGAAAGRQPS